MTYLLALVWLLLPGPVEAVNYQQCPTSSTCTIGEFLYDDTYQPQTGAGCTLSAKYPNGTVFLNNVAVTGTADAWYAYDAATGTTEGLYRASLCCTTTNEYLCLDKSFEVKAASTTLTAD